MILEAEKQALIRYIRETEQHITSVMWKEKPPPTDPSNNEGSTLEDSSNNLLITRSVYTDTDLDRVTYPQTGIYYILLYCTIIIRVFCIPHMNVAQTVCTYACKVHHIYPTLHSLYIQYIYQIIITYLSL